MSEPTVIINATVGLSEIIKATAHQRIAAMEQEIEKQTAAARSADARRQNVEQAISDLLYESAPQPMRALLDCAVDAMHANEISVWWNANDPNSDTFTVCIDRNCYRDPQRSNLGINANIEYRTKRWEVSDEVSAMMAAAVRHHAGYVAATNEAMRLSSILRARDFRDRLEGELMSRFIEGQAPDIARQIAAVATDTASPRLVGVK